MILLCNTILLLIVLLVDISYHTRIIIGIPATRALFPPWKLSAAAISQATLDPGVRSRPVGGREIGRPGAGAGVWRKGGDDVVAGRSSRSEDDSVMVW